MNSMAYWGSGALIVASLGPISALGAPIRLPVPIGAAVSIYQNGVIDLTQPLTLDRAIQIGLQNQSTIAIAGSEYKASRERITEANQSYYPQITPSYQYTNQRNGIPSTTTFGNSNGTFSTTQNVTQITTKQLILDSGQREENAAVSRNSARAAQYNVLDTRQGVILTITTDYYDLLRSKDLERVAASSVDRTRTTRDATQAFADAGTVAKKDVLQADADYENAQVQLIQAQNNVNLAETTLKSAMGIRTTQPIVTPALPPVPPPAAADSSTLEKYLAQAFDNRPDLKREVSIVEANRHSEKAAVLNSGLQLQSTFSDGYQLAPTTGDDHILDLTVSYPLFDGDASRARAREVHESVVQAREQAELTKQSIQFAVEQSFDLREEARLQAGASQAALAAAQTNYEAAQESQKLGVNTIVDVITAQTTLVTAETNAVQALYNYYTADAGLLRAIGNNDPYLARGVQP